MAGHDMSRRGFPPQGPSQPGDASGPAGGHPWAEGAHGQPAASHGSQWHAGRPGEPAGGFTGPSGGAYRSAEERTGMSREDTESILAARQDLGKEYKPALVDAFMERLDHAIDARVQARVDAHMAQKPRFSGGVIAVPFASLIFAIPLSAIAGGIAQLSGLILVWSAIVVINVAYAVRRSR